MSACRRQILVDDDSDDLPTAFTSSFPKKSHAPQKYLLVMVKKQVTSRTGKQGPGL